MDTKNKNYETPPVQAGSITFGEIEAEILPFENKMFEFDRINEHLRGNPAARSHVVPNALISSCSECCMEKINGQPNILGKLFRASRKGKGCSQCPVAIASENLPARRADGRYIRNRNGRILSEADIVRMAEDGEK